MDDHVGREEVRVVQPSDDLERVIRWARALLRKGACVKIVDPEGRVLKHATGHYRIPATLRDLIIQRFRRCVFPGCSRRAHRCDIDHTTAYPAGATCPCGLAPLCRYHHQLKQHPRWHLAQPYAGTMTWTSPTGRRYTTDVQEL